MLGMPDIELLNILNIMGDTIDRHRKIRFCVQKAEEKYYTNKNSNPNVTVNNHKKTLWDYFLPGTNREADKRVIAKMRK